MQTTTKMITPTEAKDLLFGINDGAIFGVTFTKKDGSMRDMTCRRRVKKGVKGVGMSYDPKAKGLLTVFDMQKNGFRMVNTDTVTRIAWKGDVYLVEE